jgi:predicted methyltransferase
MNLNINTTVRSYWSKTLKYLYEMADKFPDGVDLSVIKRRHFKSIPASDIPLNIVGRWLRSRGLIEMLPGSFRITEKGRKLAEKLACRDQKK